MNSFDSAISGAFEAQRSVAGNLVTYHRKDAFTELTAVEGATSFDIQDSDGVVIEYRSKDFMVPACELSLNGESVTPQQGDEIQRTIGGKKYIYRVSRPDGNEQPWRYMDSGMSQIRIHTKLTETVDV